MLLELITAALSFVSQTIIGKTLQSNFLTNHRKQKLSWIYCKEKFKCSITDNWSWKETLATERAIYIVVGNSIFYLWENQRKFKIY